MSYCPKCGGKCGPTLIECTCPPTVKLPQRYEVVSSGCASEEDDGQWMRAEDVISELNAAGIAWERGCRGK